MRLLRILRIKWKAWNYKKKYGIPIEEGIEWYGKHVIIKKEEKEENTLTHSDKNKQCK